LKHNTPLFVQKVIFGSGFPRLRSARCQAIWKMKCEAFQTDQTSNCGWWDCSELSRCFGEIIPRVRISLAKRFETADYLTKCGVSARVRASIGVFSEEGYWRWGCDDNSRPSFGEIVPRVRISLAKCFETAAYLTKCGVSARVRAFIEVFYDPSYVMYEGMMKS